MTMNEDVILITEKNLLRIKQILSFKDSEDYENLEIELDRAKFISDDDAPADLVTMNSKIKFLNIQDNNEMVITILYPHEANYAEGRISVLASLGSALIGLRVGQQINWMFPDEKTKTLKILEVIYQPEANGNFHL
jgi:regulator of nucleoside diphosphate kinase